MTEKNIELVTEDHLDYHFKTHGLIYASTSLTCRMMDMFALMLTHMKESDWNKNSDQHFVPEYRFNTSQLTQWFDIDVKYLATTLKKPAKSLGEKQIGIEDDKGSFAYYPLLAKVTYADGTLTIKPNGELRELYIINSHKNGHAKIDNNIFKKLTNPNTKRVFEFLCRYRSNQTEMYFISVDKLQVLFGVKTDKGKVLKKTYIRHSAFISRIIAPALADIATNPIAKDKLEIITKDGLQGYEVEPSSDGGCKIRFLVKWKNQLSLKEAEACYSKISSLMQQKQDIESEGGDVLPTLREIHSLFLRLGNEGHAEVLEDEINKLVESNRISDEPNEEELKLAEKRREVDNMFEQMFLKK